MTKCLNCSGSGRVTVEIDNPPGSISIVAAIFKAIVVVFETIICPFCGGTGSDED